jgi:hypothetical protein
VIPLAFFAYLLVLRKTCRHTAGGEDPSLQGCHGVYGQGVGRDLVR